MKSYIVIVITVLALTACSSDPEIKTITVTETLPGQTVTNTVVKTETNTETVTNTVVETVTETITVEVPVEDTGIDPCLEYVRVMFDRDGDGYGNSRDDQMVSICDSLAEDAMPWDDDQFEGRDDCDDVDPTINPLADELYDGFDNDCDGLVDGIDPDYQDPTLTVGYESWMGDQLHFVGDTAVDFGNIYFDPSEPMWVSRIELLDYVDTDPGALFGGYSPIAEDEVTFMAHFVNCFLIDIDGNVMAGPANPDWRGFIAFTTPVYLESFTLFNVVCDHTGLMPEDDYDGFSVDVQWDTSTMTVETDAWSAPVEISLGNQNGYAHPSTRVVISRM